MKQFSLLLLVVFCVLGWAGAASAGPDYFSTGDGHSGALSVAAGESRTVNEYSGLAADATAGESSIEVDDGSLFEAGDLVLLWQAAGFPHPGVLNEQNTVDITTTDVGRFEFARVVSASAASDTLTLVDGLSATFDEVVTQVVRVPEYSSVNIAATGQVVAQPWNGDTGGIVVFLVNGALVNDGQVSAAAAGFRPGTDRGDSGENGCNQLNPANGGQTETDNTSQKGEGIVSERFGSSFRARSNVVNGGGGAVCHNSGPGAGGHAGPGGKGGRTWRDDPDPDDDTTGRDAGGLGGVALSYSPALRLTMGGGGGAAHQNNDVGGIGGAGGGVVFVRAGSVAGAGAFNANGADGQDSQGSGNDAGGAAGAGGAVVLRAEGALSCGSAAADGGEGGSVGVDDHGTGGGGGGGYVLLQSETLACGTSASGGPSGTQTDLNDPNGPNYSAEPGGAGVANVLDSSFPVDTDGDSIPDVVEGAVNTDGDAVVNYLDPDDDNDGIPTLTETDADSDADTVPNHLDKDSDNDGIPDVVEAGAGDGGDGVLAGFTDDNDNGVDDTLEGTPLVPTNSDADGIPDFLDLDSDADGLPDALEVGLPVGTDGRIDGFEDLDGDGLHDAYPVVQPNTDAMGAPDFQDVDSDGDSINDAIEAFDDDGDRTADVLPLGNDHDSDGIDDQFDGDCPAGAGCAGGATLVNLMTLTPAQDSDQNGVPDWLQLCLDGYATAGEACDDGDTDNENACSNACLANLGEMCGVDGDCVSTICEAGTCGACTDDTVGGVDTGCTAALPTCRSGGAEGSTCTLCADTAAGAGVDEGCSADAPTCLEDVNDGEGACRGCLDATECDDGSACTTDSCDVGVCNNVPVAAGDACLDGETGFCDATQTCVACVEDDNCPAATPVCDASGADPTCVECVQDDQCVGGVCGADKSCEACRDDQPLAETDSGCDAAAPLCDVSGAAPTCGACLDSEPLAGTDLGCRAAAPVCDVAADPATCVGCLMDADCPMGESCSPVTKTCAPGCTTDADCETPEAPVCKVPDQTCVECLMASDCAQTEECDADACGPPDSDGDGVPDDLDPDDDNDGIRDVDELGGNDLSVDTDGDGVADYADPDQVECVDADDSGGCDELPQSVDADGDGVPNQLDLDADGDGIVDVWENGGSELDVDRDGLVDAPVDADADGLLAQFDEDDNDDQILTTEPALNTDETGGPDHLDLDADGDGIRDVVEANGSDADEDGRQDGDDGDGNGLVASVDPAENGTPLDPPDTDEDEAFDFQDTDTDADGIVDSIEGFDVDADGKADTLPSGVDADGDGIDDAFDVPGGVSAPLPDRDADGVPDFRDPDDDGDGIPTPEETGPDPQNPLDGDNNGTPDYLDGDGGDAGPGMDAGAPTPTPTPDAQAPAPSIDASAPEPPSTPSEPDEEVVPPGLAGGAGCSAAPGRSSAPYWALGWLLVGAGFFRRRKKLAVSMGALLMVFSLSPGAQAQAGFNLNRYQPAQTPKDQFQLSRPNDIGHGKVGVQLLLDYSNDPLVLESRQGSSDSELQALVGDQLVAHATLAFGLADRLVLFAGVPVNLVMAGDGLAGFSSADGASPGDPWFGGRLRLFGENTDAASLSLQAAMTIPVANLADGDQAYSGDSTVSGHPELLFEVRPGGVQITTNVGARIRKEVELARAKSGTELTYGLGLTLPVAEALDLMAELHGSSHFGEFFNRAETPLELLMGGKVDVGSGWTLGASAGPGLTRGIGSPDVRVVGMLGWLAEDEPEPEPEAPPAPGDRDGDGLLDDEDGCPDDPEDKDSFEDLDGCSDPDNDEDGVLDVNDECPLEAEDPDEFEDENGCPDPDNDQDDILDTVDQCPLEAEDKDEFEDENGCPDPDNDEDGVLDPEDECPLVPGDKEAKGCPTKIRVEKARIVILDRVEFATNRDVILDRSFPILEEIRAALNANPQLKQVRVEGHTDSRGRDQLNLDLSKRRAVSVKRWLVEAGIAGTRLEAYGCGEARPASTNDTRAGRQANRRVEFHVIDPAPAVSQVSDGCESAE